jgi:hypothetical protein
MNEIEMHKMSDDFGHCWNAAGMHLSKQVDAGLLSWLRAHPHPPFLEHLSFRLGNQLFFIRVEDAAQKLTGPGDPQGHIIAARQANGRACVMPMKKKFLGGNWVADMPGWGLIDASTRKPIDPIAFVTDEKIEMTQWEVNDMAVQIVRNYLQAEGFEIMTWQGDPEVDPAIWFVGESKQPEWVVVRSTAFPSKQAAVPSNWDAIAAQCRRLGASGYFASVAIASANQPFASLDEAPVPLWRGHGMQIEFTGLEEVSYELRLSFDLS